MAAEEALCCCEYYNRRGERMHILACCCACDELDAAADRLLRGRGLPSAEAAGVLREIDDRCRLPFPRGAWHIGVPGALPWLLLPLAAAAAAASARLLLLLALLLLPSLLLASRLCRRSRFLPCWVLASLWYEALVLLRCEASGAWFCLAAASVLLFVLTATLPPTLDGVADAKGAAARAVSCRVSGLLVPRYDHFCFWIDQPVGAHNHRAFLGFVLSITLTCAVGAYLLAQHAAAEGWEWSRLLLNESSLLVVCSLYGGAVACATSALLVHQLLLIGSGRTMYEARRRRRTPEGAVKAGAAQAADDTAKSVRYTGSFRPPPEPLSWWANLHEFRAQTAPLFTWASTTAPVRSETAESGSRSQ
ncbi:hypothetical protein AB1Y20_004459 [Prymnesium parvum]|uniref:Palmitoyltransferase n=1 Tax=Prymnesium parvum TaxID=97485 RepID=A0AB34IXN9_PRYPA